MSETIRGFFESATAAKNAMEDLLATGIPREEIYLDDETNEIKVMVPASAKPEIIEILKRHQPTTIS
jgi:hypothetical protein